MTNAEWNQRHEDAMAADRARWAFAELPFPPEPALPVHNYLTSQFFDSERRDPEASRKQADQERAR